MVEEMVAVVVKEEEEGVCEEVAESRVMMDGWDELRVERGNNDAIAGGAVLSNILFSFVSLALPQVSIVFVVLCLCF